MFNNKLSIFHLIVASVMCSLVTFIICYENFKHDKPIKSAMAATAATAGVPLASVESSCSSVTHRLRGYQYVKPRLYGDKTCETGRYNDLKSELIKSIDQFKQAGAIDDASIYLKILDNGDEFLSVNQSQGFHPGSLIKLPILITFMKMEEIKPGFLSTKLDFVVPPKGLPHQTYNSHQIEPGKSYSIKDLLKYMVAYSDNNATYLLNNNVDLSLFKQIFVDLGLPEPDVHDIKFTITAQDYSAFLKVIYNASYLSIPHSEFVAELLSQCDFKEGIQKGLPQDIKIAHKFGEWGDKNNPSFHQLSESGIIYLKGTEYLITVMTQGKDVKRLPQVLSTISELAYTHIKEKL